MKYYAVSVVQDISHWNTRHTCRLKQRWSEENFKIIYKISKKNLLNNLVEEMQHWELP